MERTITEYAPIEKQDWERALQVQDACNLSGVVHSLSALVSRLHRDPESTGTDWVNHHPLVILYLDKLNSLAGIQYNDAPITAAYSRAYEETQ